MSRCGEAFPRAGAVGGRVLEAVGDPNVGHAGRAEGRAEGGTDLAGALAVFDPEISYPSIVMREREAVGRLRVGEAGGVEVEAEAAIPRPFNPVAEVLGADGVPIDPAATELAVESVKVHAVPARDHRQRGLEIGAELFRVASAARVISRHRQTAARWAERCLEAGDVVSLPAVERDRDSGECRDRGVDIDAQGGVLFPRETDRLIDAIVS